jgi:hypothetical protein
MVPVVVVDEQPAGAETDDESDATDAGAERTGWEDRY